MDILDTADNPILTNLRLSINYQLLQQYKAVEGLPRGDFVLLDMEHNPVTGGVTFDSLGKRYQLIFLTDEEIEVGKVA